MTLGAAACCCQSSVGTEEEGWGAKRAGPMLRRVKKKLCREQIIHKALVRALWLFQSFPWEKLKWNIQGMTKPVPKAGGGTEQPRLEAELVAGGSSIDWNSESIDEEHGGWTRCQLFSLDQPSNQVVCTGKG